MVFPTINLSSSFLNCIYFNEIDFDFKKFFDLLISLKSSNFEKRHEDFISDLKGNGLFKFEIYINVCSHIAARNYYLNQILREGVKALYARVFTKVDEEDVIASLKSTLLRDFIREVDDPATFSDEFTREWWMETYGPCTHERCAHSRCEFRRCRNARYDSNNLIQQCPHFFLTARPARYVIRVPYNYALALVRQRHFYIEKGYVYLTYHHVDMLMMCYWDYKVKMWQDEDDKNVVRPMLELACASIEPFAPKFSPERGAEMKHFYRDHTVGPVHDAIRMDLYCHESDDLIFAFYKAAIGSIQEMCSSEPGSSAVATLTASSHVQHIEEYTADGETFNQRYLKVLPPCILGIIRRHLGNQTHPKNEERKLLFKFLCFVNIPLDHAEEMWRTILNNAKDLRGQMRTLLADPKGLYASYSRPEARRYPFNGCKSMKDVHNACPIGDIEDLGTRQRCCSEEKLWVDRLKQPKSLKPTWSPPYWSPINAYNSLVKFHQEKKIN